MTPFQQRSPFIEPVAVEAWDAWFRWRHRGELRDVAIEDTWRRVAVALASVENADARQRWAARFLRALAGWRLLPDERVLAAAGTGVATWRDGELHAALNIAAFVPVAGHATPGVDLAAIGRCAAVAVRALDNAAVLAGVVAPRLRIGMVGIADALLLLGLEYDSAAARAQAAVFARAVAAACLRANAERIHARRRATEGMPQERVPERRHGRHPRLTAITPQSRLALLANDVADALDPLLGRSHRYTIAGPAGPRSIQASGYALGVLHADGRPHAGDGVGLRNVPMIAQLEMRAAVQPWIDEPIDYPLLLTAEPGPEEQAEAWRRADALGLRTRSWRIRAAPGSCVAIPSPARVEEPRSGAERAP